MIARNQIAVSALLAGLIMAGIISAQTALVNDSLKIDTTAVDSMPPVNDSLWVNDSLLQVDSLTPDMEEPSLPPPYSLLDSLTYHYSARQHFFDVNQYDLYPRNASGLINSETSFFTQTYYEWPFRTTVAPYGLTAGQINVQAGPYEIRPYDRTIPADGKTDFNDIRTGDIVSARLIEGPLSAYSSSGGGLAMLYLEPQPLPEDRAHSEFTVERGSYGYAYTRARFARMFTPNLGLAFTTDYRTAEGFNPNADDDMYNINGRLVRKYGAKTILNLYLNAYHRDGGFPVEPDSGGFTFRRDRRDQHFVASLTRQDFWGGQLVGAYQLQRARSSYSRTGNAIYRVIKPRDNIIDLAYTGPYKSALYEFSLRLGKEEYDIDQLFKSRFYGQAMLVGQIEKLGAYWFFFGRAKKADSDKALFDGAIGTSKEISSKWKAIVSFGMSQRRPDLAELYGIERSDIIGSTGALSGLYTERSNPDLAAAEKRLTGNISIAYASKRGSLSVSFNAGQLDDLIYYNREYGTTSGLEVYPDNDNGSFADLNVSGSFNSLGPFYGMVSLSGRRVDTDRWGDRPPYSPRWQVYGRLGLRCFVNRFKIGLRLFADVSYSEKPLSYQLEELETTAPITVGFNAALKDLTFYYKIDNLLNQYHPQPQGYGLSGYYYSWGFNWKFFD